MFPVILSPDAAEGFRGFTGLTTRAGRLTDCGLTAPPNNGVGPTVRGANWVELTFGNIELMAAAVDAGGAVTVGEGDTTAADAGAATSPTVAIIAAATAAATRRAPPPREH
jgi:hypothetical protein